jgi:hypothetical protein
VVSRIRSSVLTDTLDGDDDAIADGDVGGERPNDQRGVAGVSGTAATRAAGPGVVVVRRAL